MSATQSVGKLPPREYETIYILRADTAKEAAQKVAERVGDAIGKEGGTLTAVESWGRRQLAYAVGKQRRGVYVYLKYLGRGAVVTELERNLRMLDSVIKFQTVLTNDEVDVANVKVDPKAVVFDDVEPPADDDVEETLEQRLGLVEGAPRVRDERSGAEGAEDGFANPVAVPPPVAEEGAKAAADAAAKPADAEAKPVAEADSKEGAES